ncbi:MAG: MXAN_5187 C-terminal domain-containing protein [Deltaproteobacteria bacterium]
MLEAKVARLKVEYEQYFLRVIKMEPLKLREDVDRMVLLYSNQSITNTSLKFRFNSTISRYNSYRQYWTRVLRAIDDGTYWRKAEGGFEGVAAAPPVKQTAGAPPRESGPAALRPPDGEISDVYKKYIDARKACNETVDGITYDMIARTIEQHRQKIESQYNTKDLELKVYIKDNKAKLAISPKKK